MRIALIFMLLPLVLLAGCGKYAKPIPPEMISPRSVESLEVRTDVQGVHFHWQAPDRDLRGKELKSLDGYFIYRKQLSRASDATNRKVPYELIGTVEDTHLRVREERREAARAEGKPGRRIDVESGLKEFDFTDSKAEPGGNYIYKIVPYNQGDVEGEARNLIKVLFRGESSEVTSLENESEAEEELY